MIFTNLLTNMVVLGMANVIPANTPAFQEYAVHTMLTNADRIAAVWNLPVKPPLTKERVTANSLRAHPLGIHGAITIDNRFTFRASNGRFDGFVDIPYECQVFLTDDVQKNDAVLERWIQMTNLLTLQKAQQIANSARVSIGLTADKTKLNKPKTAAQRKYNSDGKIYPLPYYVFRWENELWGNASALVHIDVSGLTSNVVHFTYIGSLLRLDRPANYLELLGLSTNTVFVRARFRPSGTVYEVYEP